MAEINLKKLTAGSSGPTEIDVNFNGTLEGQADTTIPIEVNLTDGVNPVTPTSVALTGNDLDIVIPAPVVPSGILFKTIIPTQYTSYRTGDEGWRVQNNWFDYTPPIAPKVISELDYTSANFFNVLESPLIVNGVSSTTRFVDVNGIQAFSSTGNANLVVIDKLTGLMYANNISTLRNWDVTIDDALAYSITVNSILYDDWFLTSKQEILSIFHDYAGIGAQIDTLTSVDLFPVLSAIDTVWCATTYANLTTAAHRYQRNVRGISAIGKTADVNGRIYVRNARNLITAP
jgi:hypothetical protein